MKTMKEFLTESSMSRMHTYARERNLGVISAYRGEHTEKENRERHKQLEKDLRGLGYGVIHAHGGFVENKGTPQEQTVTERSFIVGGSKEDDKGKLLSDLKKLGEKYNQDSVLHKPLGSDTASYHYTNDVGYANKGDIKPVGQFKGDHFAMVRSDDDGSLIGRAFTSLMKGSHQGRRFAYAYDEVEADDKTKHVGKERNLNLKESVQQREYDTFELSTARTYLNTGRV
jgi:hypothetical protein